MKCPSCNKTAKYITKKETRNVGKGTEKIPRTDFRAKCKCGWSGEI